MTSFKNMLICAASAVILTACATATPYQPASKPGGFDGFSQTMIENDRARITFGGNSLTKRETVENSLLYRAAEMAVERGFDYFTLAERDTEAKTRVTVDQFGSRGLYDPYFNYSFYRPRYGWSRGYRYSRFGGFYRGRGFRNRGFHNSFHDPFFDDFNVREITKYRTTAEVLFGKGSKPMNKDNAFNAREVLQNLSGVIEFPEEG
jgi:hypothetical protein